MSQYIVIELKHDPCNEAEDILNRLHDIGISSAYHLIMDAAASARFDMQASFRKVQHYREPNGEYMFGGSPFFESN